MIGKLGLYYRSLKYLKSKQISYRVYYMLRSKMRRSRGFSYSFSKSSQVQDLSLVEFPLFENSYLGQGRFRFLNKEHHFDSIDWDYAAYGKLWTYNLNYFDFVNQKDASAQSSKLLMKQFVKELPALKNANEPYPISLRLINWIKCFTRFSISDKELNDSLYAQAYILKDQLEYHLLGNHLLENGFGLVFAGVYFSDKKLLNTGLKIFKSELKEQILEDGAHFELSPMYHQIILLRLLDTYNLCKENGYSDIMKLIQPYLEKMLCWLETMTFKDESIPMLNDSAFNITPGSRDLFEYASRLSLEWKESKLSQSGYRKWNVMTKEMIIDVGHVGPSYIPGHAHADTFNFVLQSNEGPIIVDLGTSTYEANQLRLDERGTSAHNTVVYNAKNSSEVWSSFRVGDRAEVIELLESENEIKASHNGYKDVIHTRIFRKQESGFEIEDFVSGVKPSKAYIHLHPDVNIHIENGIIQLDDIKISFSNVNRMLKEKEISIKDYNFAEGFNKVRPAKLLEISFVSQLLTTISI